MSNEIVETEVKSIENANEIFAVISSEESKIDFKEFGIDALDALELGSLYKDKILEYKILHEKYVKLAPIEVTKENTKEFKELRLSIRRLRLEISGGTKDPGVTKKYLTNARGRIEYVKAIEDLQKDFALGMEDVLEKKEKHIAEFEAKQKQITNNKRVNELLDYGEVAPSYLKLSDLDDDEYKDFLGGIFAKNRIARIRDLTAVHVTEIPENLGEMVVEDWDVLIQSEIDKYESKIKEIEVKRSKVLEKWNVNPMPVYLGSMKQEDFETYESNCKSFYQSKLTEVRRAELLDFGIDFSIEKFGEWDEQKWIANRDQCKKEYIEKVEKLQLERSEQIKKFVDIVPENLGVMDDFIFEKKLTAATDMHNKKLEREGEIEVNFLIRKKKINSYKPDLEIGREVGEWDEKVFEKYIARMHNEYVSKRNAIGQNRRGYLEGLGVEMRFDTCRDMDQVDYDNISSKAKKTFEEKTAERDKADKIERQTDEENFKMLSEEIAEIMGKYEFKTECYQWKVAEISGSLEGVE